MASLDDARAKLDWARKHLEILRAEIEPFEQRDAHRIEYDIDTDGGKYTFYVRDLDSPDPEWGLRIGDCLHNARTALDYLLVRLVCLLSGEDPRDVKTVSFPIYDDPGDFSSSTGKLRKEPRFSGYLTRIEELQPFNNGNPSVWGANPQHGRPGMSPLPIALKRLSQLDNLDKHRLIHAAWLGTRWPEAAFPEIAPPELNFITGTLNTGQLRDDAEIATWFCQAPIEIEWHPTQVEMKRQFPIHVAFDEPVPFQGVLEVLPYCLWGVEAVLALFEPVFSHLVPPLPVTTPMTQPPVAGWVMPQPP